MKKYSNQMPTINNSKTFLLGLGVQKGGTSWLHEQLNKRKDANFGFLKEYHFLDALTLDAFANFQPVRPFPWKWRTFRRHRFFQRPERYFDYFADLLNKPDISLSGDITPSYGCLSSSTLRWVIDEFEQRGVRTCAVLILRDPVERFLSQQRMKLRKAGRLEPEQERQQLLRAAQKLSKEGSNRSNHLKTLATLEHVFSRENMFIGLYEQLFTEGSYRNLCLKLKIPYQQPDWNQRVNESRSTTSIPYQTLKIIGGSQSEVYRGIALNYPHLKVQEYWPTAARWCS
tara:strand:+ start:520 stop:1377 length:858 start_codon:yes stop_codon:yes gene_type:complete